MKNALIKAVESGLEQAVELMPSEHLVAEEPERFMLIDLSGELALSTQRARVMQSVAGTPKEIMPGTPLRVAVDRGRAEKLRPLFDRALALLPAPLRRKIFPRWWERPFARGASQLELWEALELPSLRLMALGQFLGYWVIKAPTLGDCLLSTERGAIPQWRVVGARRRSWKS
jgi:hypothetical protein